MQFIDQYQVARILDMRTSQVQRLVQQRVLPPPTVFGSRVQRWERDQFETHIRRMVRDQRRRRGRQYPPLCCGSLLGG